MGEGTFFHSDGLEKSVTQSTVDSLFVRSQTEGDSRLQEKAQHVSLPPRIGPGPQVGHISMPSRIGPGPQMPPGYGPGPGDYFSAGNPNGAPLDPRYGVPVVVGPDGRQYLRGYASNVPPGYGAGQMLPPEAYAQPLPPGYSGNPVAPPWPVPNGPTYIQQLPDGSWLNPATGERMTYGPMDPGIGNPILVGDRSAGKPPLRPQDLPGGEWLMSTPPVHLPEGNKKFGLTKIMNKHALGAKINPGPNGQGVFNTSIPDEIKAIIQHAVTASEATITTTNWAGEKRIVFQAAFDPKWQCMGCADLPVGSVYYQGGSRVAANFVDVVVNENRLVVSAHPDDIPLSAQGMRPVTDD